MIDIGTILEFGVIDINRHVYNAKVGYLEILI